MAANFENGEKCADTLPIHMKTAHVLQADFENGTLTGTI